ncbi:MAG: T9SS type A sorting domain-containing protein [Crocinitomicaceae bacterium]|nr:T9SS type A sorting domain-containing protein [Crocinitomicaceae bacterium]
MKKIFMLLALISAIEVSAQIPGCQEKNLTHLTTKTLFKSGNEALRSDTINVLAYDIYMDFTLAGSGTLSGFCEVKFSPLQSVSSLNLDLLQMTVDSVVVHGSQIAYSYNDTLLVSHFGSVINAGQTDSLTVYYHGAPQMDPSGWGGFYMTGGYYYNLGVGFQSDPHNYGRVWHPCFDNFVERAGYRFSILSNNNNTAYCNGTRQSVTNVGTDSLLTVWQLDDEIPSYLASVAVASYTHVSQMYYSNLQSMNIPVWLAAKPADTTNLKNSFIHLHDALSAFENYYGPYVWERVGYVLVPFNSGAMEHATNIAYPLATANGNTTYETLMAHELSHHWWGNLVTCKTAEEMWINEGMARYAEHLFTEALYGYDEYMEAMRANHYDVLHKAHINDSGYYALNAVPIKFTYGDHSYNKGADVMHTLRSYMGDTAFFNALQSIQSNFAGQNISSEEFMNHINSVSSVNVTDFFNAWIFQPGFANFSITHLNILPSGSDFLVKVVVAQKLKGGAAYHENVPLQLTFMDENWNVNTQEIILPGHYAEFSFTLPFSPVFAGVNLNEKINDATTAITETITAEGTYQFNYANTRLVVSNLTDSAFLRIEHCWVYPDMMNVPDNIQISRERYWNIHGVDLENIEGNLRFEFNGKTIISGNFDNHLLVDLGDQPFIEDSLVLLYRPTAQSSWQVHDDYTLQFTGSHTDKFGYITAETFAPGQYAFGYRTHSVGIQNTQKNDRLYSVYPNPANDSMIIDLSNWDSKQVQLTVFGIEGKLAMQQAIQAGQKNLIDISNLNAGTYIITISDYSGMVIGSMRVVVE